MAYDDINDGIIKLESRKSHLVNLVASLNTVKAEQSDMSSEFDELINKLKTKISKTDKQIKELCDYAVEIAMAESSAYDAYCESDDKTCQNTDSCYFF